MHDRARRVLHAQWALAEALTPDAKAPRLPREDTHDVGVWVLQDQNLLKAPVSHYRTTESPLGERLAHTMILTASPWRVLATARWDLEQL